MKKYILLILLLLCPSTVLAVYPGTCVRIVTASQYWSSGTFNGYSDISIDLVTGTGSPTGWSTKTGSWKVTRVSIWWKDESGWHQRYLIAPQVNFPNAWPGVGKYVSTTSSSAVENPPTEDCPVCVLPAVWDPMTDSCVTPPNPCSDKLADAISICGSEANVDKLNDLDENGCPTMCICPHTGIQTERYAGDWTTKEGLSVCLPSPRTAAGCKWTVGNVTYMDPINDPLCEGDATNFEDYCASTGISSVPLVAGGGICTPETVPPGEVPDDPRDNCGQAKANCAIKCGSINLIDKFECTEDDAETGGTASSCECKELITCEEEEATRAKACGGPDNFAGFQCHMESGKPVVEFEGYCVAPPDEQNCTDLLADCTEYCGPGNDSTMQCRDMAYGPMVTVPCGCKEEPKTCPAGRICDNDGVCQPGESPTSIDCAGDKDNDNCPDGQICPGDGHCQAGESKDTYDCGGNNDGNTKNDPGGNGEQTGPDNSGSEEECPPGSICHGDGICQAGESTTAADCSGTGTAEEGEAGEGGTTNGLCPPGSICHGDGVCQPNEPSTAVDCAGGNYTTARFTEMAAVLQESSVLGVLEKGFNVPSGGSSNYTVNLGSVGGNKSFDLGRFGAVWAILNALFTLTATWAAVKIIILKR